MNFLCFHMPTKSCRIIHKTSHCGVNLYRSVWLPPQSGHQTRQRLVSTGLVKTFQFRDNTRATNDRQSWLIYTLLANKPTKSHNLPLGRNCRFRRIYCPSIRNKVQPIVPGCSGVKCTGSIGEQATNTGLPDEAENY